MASKFSSFDSLSIASLGPSTLPKETKRIYDEKVLANIDGVAIGIIRNKPVAFESYNSKEKIIQK